jgi:hypothetical protein
MIRVEAKNSARKRIKGLIVALVVVGGVALIPASSAAAHVHGITPLLCVPSADQPGTGTTGANQTDNTPAAEANRGPLPFSGLIPLNPGQSDGHVGNGGSDTPPCD